MKIGIYIRESDPKEGGGSTFIKTIDEQLKSLSANYEIVICYRSNEIRTLRQKIGDIEYINVRLYKRKILPQMIGKRISLNWQNFINYLKFGHKQSKEVSFWDILAENEKIDLFWFTWPEYDVLSTPYIYTVWDLGHRIVPMFPEVSRPISNWNTRENMYQDMIYRASYVTIGNETGKREILENYPIPENKIRVVPFPISNFCYGEELKPDFNLPDEYFFYPAQFWPHKNHVCIIESLRELRDVYGKKVYIVFTGSDKGNKTYIQELVDKYNLADQVIFAGFLSDECMKYLYTHSKALIYASLMGPNNLPPLEAAYLGCPVIISNIDGHKEQMKNAAIYFDGCSSKSLSKVLDKFLSNPSITNELKKNEEIMISEYVKKTYASYISDIFSEFEIIRRRWN